MLVILERHLECFLDVNFLYAVLFKDMFPSKQFTMETICLSLSSSANSELRRLQFDL